MRPPFRMFQLTLDFLERKFVRSKRVRPSQVRPHDHHFTWKHDLTVHVVYRARARRYLLRLQPDGAARLVIPRRGTEAEAVKFLERSEPWLLKRLAQWRNHSESRQPWGHGTTFLFRGNSVSLAVETNASGISLRFADEIIALKSGQDCYRAAVLARLRKRAEDELPVRTLELAAQHQIAVRRVSVRAQKSRWGSCSANGTISLNWRLIHAPVQVIDYLILHELMHRREMNHSARFWKQVASVCPSYEEAERWLRGCRIEQMP